MKKTYLFTLALGLGIVVNAQHDLGVTLDNYTSGAATSDDPLEMDFTVTNVGAATVANGDSIFFALSLGANYYAINDLTPGYVGYVKLTSDMVQNDAFQIDVATITMDWVYQESGLNENICITILGVNIQVASPPVDPAPANNQACVDYTVTEVASLTEGEMETISVYPNPANNEINFSIGTTGTEAIRVFDMSGREVANLQVTGTIETLSTEGFENDVFYYQLIKGEEVVKTDKFVVSH